MFRFLFKNSNVLFNSCEIWQTIGPNTKVHGTQIFFTSYLSKLFPGECFNYHCIVHNDNNNNIYYIIIYTALYPSHWFLVPARLRVSTTAIAQIPDISSEEGAVIGAVLSTRKFHHGHQT
jgi:hypothetical protein